MIESVFILTLGVRLHHYNVHDISNAAKDCIPTELCFLDCNMLI